VLNFKFSYISNEFANATYLVTFEKFISGGYYLHKSDMELARETSDTTLVFLSFNIYK